MFDQNRPEIRFALEAVSQASEVASLIRESANVLKLKKSDRSPVSIGDFAIQALVGCLIEKQFPDAVLVGEEESSMLRDPGSKAILDQVLRFVRHKVPDADVESLYRWIDWGTREASDCYWTLDPIDGTRGFIRGEQYAVALAFIEKGDVKIAALGCPVLSKEGQECLEGPGSITLAVKGEGAWIAALDGKNAFTKLQVSDCEDPSNAGVLRSFESSHTNAECAQKLLEALRIPGAPVLMDSQAKYVALAAGQGDMLFYLLPPKDPRYRWKIWDVAPGALVIEEAGGIITDLLGNPLDFGSGTLMPFHPGILASNGRIHAKVVEAFKNLLATDIHYPL